MYNSITMDGASGGGKDGVENGVDDNNDNNSTQVREEDDACSEVETEEGALASSEGYSADYSESISSGSSSSSSDRRENRDTMGHVHTKDDGDDTIVDIKDTQKKLDAASPSRDDPHNGQQQNKNNAHHAKRRHSGTNIEQNAHRHRHKHHNKEPHDVNRQMDEIMNLYNVR